MTVLCAWCGKVIHGELRVGEVVSHGLCPSCDEKLRKEAGLPPRSPAGPGDEPEDSPETDPALHDEREVEREAEEREDLW